MTLINKTVYEEIFRYHEFKRADGRGWLNTSETITSCTVTITEEDTGTDVSGSMISNVSAYTNTKVKYKLLAGESGKFYIIKIKIVSSNAQNMEDRLQLYVE